MTIRGGTTHRVYSVVVFIVLASMDNVAIGIVPPLYGSIGATFGVGEAAIALATTVMFLISAVAAVGFAYAGDRTNRKPVLVIEGAQLFPMRLKLVYEAAAIASDAGEIQAAHALADHGIKYAPDGPGKKHFEELKASLPPAPPAPAEPAKAETPAKK